VHERRKAKEPSIIYMYTTAFVRHEEDEAAIAENVTENTPGYTAYGEWYAVCDKFNKNFCDRT
jgi:hypothetical protein